MWFPESQFYCFLTHSGNFNSSLHTFSSFTIYKWMFNGLEIKIVFSHKVEGLQFTTIFQYNDLIHIFHKMILSNSINLMMILEWSYLPQLFQSIPAAHEYQFLFTILGLQTAGKSEFKISQYLEFNENFSLQIRTVNTNFKLWLTSRLGWRWAKMINIIRHKIHVENSQYKCWMNFYIIFHCVYDNTGFSLVAVGCRFNGNSTYEKPAISVNLVSAGKK